MTCGCKDHGDGASEINSQPCITKRPCSQPIASGNCVSCGCGPCQCGQSTVATPTPYYNQAPGVQECHKQVVIQQSFVTAISTSSSFNMPACNATATITVPGLNKIQVGSYLWNVNYGYLVVVSFDYVNSQITVKNECQAGNASPGTNIPACTMFNVVDPPLTGSAALFGVFLAVDFVAPDVGNCIDIQVTGVAGLTVGQNIQVGSGIYGLSAIVSPTIITICNNGSGVTHGVVVPAKDNTGQYITPITPLSTNACTNTAQATGALLSCHNGVQAPLDGLAIGQIPVLVNTTTNEVQFQSLDLPTAVCTTMTSCLNLIAATNTYIIVVADNTIFALGDIIIIHDPLIETYRWEVTNLNVDTVHVTITLVDPAPPNTLTAEVGCNDTPICLAPCCEQLQAGTQICTYDWSAAFKTEQHTGAVNNTGTVTPNIGGPTVLFPGDEASITFENSTCNDMSITITLDFLEQGVFSQVGNVLDGGTLIPDESWVTLEYFNAVDDVLIANAFPAAVYTSLLTQPEHLVWNSETADESFTRSYSSTKTYNVAAGHKIRINSKMNFYYVDFSTDVISPGSRGSYAVGIHRSSIAGLGVAVQAAP